MKATATFLTAAFAILLAGCKDKDQAGDWARESALQALGKIGGLEISLPMTARGEVEAHAAVERVKIDLEGESHPGKVVVLTSALAKAEKDLAEKSAKYLAAEEELSEVIRELARNESFAKHARTGEKTLRLTADRRRSALQAADLYLNAWRRRDYESSRELHLQYLELLP